MFWHTESTWKGHDTRLDDRPGSLTIDSTGWGAGREVSHLARDGQGTVHIEQRDGLPGLLTLRHGRSTRSPTVVTNGGATECGADERNGGRMRRRDRTSVRR